MIAAKIQRRVLDFLYTRRFRAIPGVVAHPTVRCFGKPIVTVAPGATIHVGANVVLTSRSEGTALGVAHPVILRATEAGAQIKIGADTGISGGSFCATQSIVIGERCLFGADVTVADTDFHPVDKIPRRYEKNPISASRAVEIGDDVFVGTRSVILKGSKIGNGCVIGSCSLVTGTIQERMVAAGNPCREIRPVRIENVGPG